MKPQKYKLTSYNLDKSRTRIWDATSPMPIDKKFKWILEGTPDQPQIRFLSERTDEIESNRIIPISRSAIENNDSIPLSDLLRIQLRHLKPIPPAYLLSEKSSQAGDQLIVFSGSGRSLIDSQLVSTAYVGYVRSKPTFTLQSTAEGYHLRPLLPGVQLKLKNQRPMTGGMGDTWKLSREDLTHCTLIRGSRWWRFTLCRSLAGDLSEISEIGPSEESKTFRNIVIALGLLFTVIVTSVVYFAPPTKVKEEQPEAPVVKFVSTHPKEKPKPPEPIKPPEPVKMPEPVKPAPKTPEPKKPAEMPKPKEPVKPKVEKSLPKAPIAQKAPGLPAKPAAPKAPPVDAKAVAAARAASQMAAMMKEAKASTALLSKRKAANVAAGSTSSAKEIFNASTSGIKPTEIAAQYTSDSQKIREIGGGEKGAKGYATSQVSDVAGKSGSFVSVDTSDMAVERGLLPSEVGEVIHRHMSEIRYCHESALLDQPRLNGKVIVQFSINPMGKIERSKIQNTTVNNPTLENCILSKLGTWQFPKPKGGVHVAVSYPFLFKVLDRD